MQMTFTGLQEDREAAPTTDNSGSAICFTGSAESPQPGTCRAWYMLRFSSRGFNFNALCLPGTYQSGRPIVTIVSFATKLMVISSKQRPRRLVLCGSDGIDYQFVLKGIALLSDLYVELTILTLSFCHLLGHEDLRQDERVMQLFSLVNTLLSVDTDSFKRRLNIQRFPVIPLAPNAGLLGWVKDSDTLHVLVRDYRESKKVLLNIEYRLMLQVRVSCSVFVDTRLRF